MAEGKGISRRELLKRAGIGAGGLAVSGAAAPQVWAAPRVSQADQTIKIGFVSPLTGPASGFGEPDPYVLGLAKAALAKGLTIGGTTYSVEVVNKDGQSTPSASAQAANDLINSEKVDLMLTTSTPEVVNPVSDACEAAGVPCISTVVPWEAWYFGRGAKPGKPSPFRYTYHFCFGVAELLRHLHAPLAAGEDEQGRRRDVAERRRRQRDPRARSGRCSRRPATRSSTRAPTRTARTTTRRRSRSSSRPGSRSSTRSRSRPTSRRSGGRRRSRG